MLEAAVDNFDATFYIKLSDDVAANVPGVVTWLNEHKTQNNLYAVRAGCPADPRVYRFRPFCGRFPLDRPPFLLL